jgi:hypothetical protein
MYSLAKRVHKVVFQKTIVAGRRVGCSSLPSQFVTSTREASVSNLARKNNKIESELKVVEMEKDDIVYATAVPVPATQHQHQHQHQQSVPIQVHSQQHSNTAQSLPIQVQSQVLPGEQAICRGCRSNFIRDPQFSDCDAGYFRCVNCRQPRSFELSVLTDMCTVQ